MLKIILMFSVLTSLAARHTFFYRKDYTYLEDFDAYYKINWAKDGVSWNTAFLACDDEGANFFYPKEKGEWTIVKILSSGLSEAPNPNTTDVIVGIHDETGLGDFVTVDGIATRISIIEDKSVPKGHDCVIMDLETGAYKTEPCVSDDPRVFVCKKIEEKPCPTIDLGYKYVKETKKCYKINTRERTWQEAWHTCFIEGALLALPESSAEADVIFKQITNKDANYFSGFRRIFSGSEFYSLKGQKLEGSGFNRWLDRQNEDTYDCGVIYSSYYHDQLYIRSEDCNTSLPFVCEMEAKV